MGNWRVDKFPPLFYCIVTHPEAGPDEREPIILNLRSTPESE